MEADIFSQTEADKPEYQNHAVFKTIDKGIEFYDHLDYAVMGFATIGTKSIINIDSMLLVLKCAKKTRLSFLGQIACVN